MKKTGRPRVVGMRKSERKIYERLLKGPAALYVLAHATRCSVKSVKVYISRLRKHLPLVETIPRAYFDSQTYRLTRASKRGKWTKARNNLLYAPNFLPDYTLCEVFRVLGLGVKTLAQATMLRSLSVGSVKWGTA